MAFAVGAFYFAVSRAVLRGPHTRDLEALHLVLAIVFFTAGIPFLLNGRWITFAWDVEAAGLLILALWIGRQLWRNAAAVVLGLAIVRLLGTGTGFQTVLLFNPRFGLFVMTIAVAALLVFVSLQWNDVDSRYWAGGAVIAINLLALFALSLEVQDYFRPQLQYDVWTGSLACGAHCGNVHLLGAVDGIWNGADGGGVLEARGISAVASHPVAGHYRG